MSTVDVSDFGASSAFRELMDIRCMGNVAPGIGSLEVSDPVWDTRFRLGDTAAQVLSAVGVAISDLHQHKFGNFVRFDFVQRHAEAHLHSHAFTKVLSGGDWRPAPSDPHLPSMREMTQPWPTKDGRWIVLHFNLNHLKDRVLSVLRCPDEESAIPPAIRQWNADELEEAIASARACAGIVRTPEEWLKHPHGKVLAAKPVVEIERIGDSPREPLSKGGRLLAGLRVLDVTRILAGPIVTRTLAEQGADVLMIAGPRQQQIRQHVRDTSHGKRSAIVDLDYQDDLERLYTLVEGADIFSQGYRPGVLKARGFGPEKLIERRPGLIYISISCFGDGGPMSDRAGWEQIAQAVTGVCHANGGDAGPPKLIPLTACDYLCGYLGAFGALTALRLRAENGGSYHVKVSLCQAAMMLLRQGIVDEQQPARLPDDAELQTYQMIADTEYGTLRHFRPVLDIPASPGYWNPVAPILGTSNPEWQ